MQLLASKTALNIVKNLVGPMNQNIQLDFCQVIRSRCRMQLLSVAFRIRTK